MSDPTADAFTTSVPFPDLEQAEDRKQAFVQHVAALIEECGHPCIAGRIVGWLLVSDPAEQSFGELVEATGASKGSISTMTRRLEDDGLVERISRAGDRQTYFRLRSGAWRTVLHRRMALVRDLARAAECGLAQIEDPSPSVRCRLEEMRDFYAFVAEKMPGLVEEYEREQEMRRACRAET